MKTSEAKKTILFDLAATQPGPEQGFHGGGEYAKAVFLRIDELLTGETSLEVFYNPARDIENALIDICKARGFTVNYCKNNSEISQLLSDKKYDVFYSALPYAYGSLVIPPETKFIYNIFGLRHIECPFIDRYYLKYKKFTLQEKIIHTIKVIAFFIFPAWMMNRRLKRYTTGINKLFHLTKNQSIITISSHSQYAILYFFPNMNISTIKMLYAPAKNVSTGDQGSLNILERFSLESDKYILLVCGNRHEKGAYGACKVIHDLFQGHTGIPENIKVLVLGVSCKNEYIKLTKGSKRFIFSGYVSMNDLETLYKNARLFVYPTLNEGFGYPPLEAMKYGTICACSANSAVTEVCGDAVIYFNPHDEIEMGIRILQSFDDDIRRKKKEKMAIRFQAVSKKQKEDLDILAQHIIL